MFLTVIIFLAILSLLVFVHELGHFATARFFGVKCEEFGMGLPPRAIGWQKKDGHWRWIFGNREVTAGEPMVYSLNWIPIGGFVKIKGENGEAELETDSFGAKKIWQRNLILSAGVTMNVLLCVVLLSVGFMIGMPQAADLNDGGIAVSPNQVQISQVLDGYPAAGADIRVGDVIVAIDGQVIADSAELRQKLSQKENQEVAVLIKRNGEEMEKKVTIVKKEELVGLGVGIIDVGITRYPVHLAIIKGAEATWNWLVLIISALWGLLKQLLGVGPAMGLEFSGPVGIAVLTGQAAKLGWVYLLQFAAMLSLNLAIINILPFPALDGGRILFLTIGKLRGQMINPKWENFSHNAGFILLMALIVFITYRDLLKYGGKMLTAVAGLAGF